MPAESEEEAEIKRARIVSERLAAMSVEKAAGILTALDPLIFPDNGKILLRIPKYKAFDAMIALRKIGVTRADWEEPEEQSSDAIYKVFVAKEDGADELEKHGVRVNTHTPADIMSDVSSLIGKHKKINAPNETLNEQLISDEELFSYIKEFSGQSERHPTAAGSVSSPEALIDNGRSYLLRFFDAAKPSEENNTLRLTFPEYYADAITAALNNWGIENKKFIPINPEVHGVREGERPEPFFTAFTVTFDTKGELDALAAHGINHPFIDSKDSAQSFIQSLSDKITRSKPQSLEFGNLTPVLARHLETALKELGIDPMKNGYSVIVNTNKREDALTESLDRLSASLGMSIRPIQSDSSGVTTLVVKGAKNIELLSIGLPEQWRSGLR